MQGVRRATSGTEQSERVPTWAKGAAVAYVCVVIVCAAYFNYGQVDLLRIGGIASAVAVGLVVGRWRAAFLALAWPLAAGSLELLFQTDVLQWPSDWPDQANIQLVVYTPIAMALIALGVAARRLLTTTSAGLKLP